MNAEMRSERSVAMAVAMSTVGQVLAGLRLDLLPPLAGIRVGNSVMDGLVVSLQLGAGLDLGDALARWSAVLPGASGSVTECGEYLRVEVTATVAGVPVDVWDHVYREGAVRLRDVLGLGERDRVALSPGRLSDLLRPLAAAT